MYKDLCIYSVIRVYKALLMYTDFFSVIFVCVSPTTTMCCSVLQCVAVCCSVLQCATVRCGLFVFSQPPHYTPSQKTCKERPIHTQKRPLHSQKRPTNTHPTYRHSDIYTHTDVDSDKHRHTPAVQEAQPHPPHSPHPPHPPHPLPPKQHPPLLQ